MGQIKSVLSRKQGGKSNQRPELTISGIGVEWAKRIINPNDLDTFASRLFNVETPGIRELLKINRNTGINTRPVVDMLDNPIWYGSEPPSADQLDSIYRDYGVKMAVSACSQALLESKLKPEDITHVVAVTATNAGSPGYDQVVARELGISPKTERVLLSGIGCAGGLAALRVAAISAVAATQLQRPARVLVFATEVCSTQTRGELEEIVATGRAGLGPALFSDGSGAIVLCNELARDKNFSARGVYTLKDWTTATVPETAQEMSYRVTKTGFLLQLSKDVPRFAAASVLEPFKLLTGRMKSGSKFTSQSFVNPRDFDWACHPGGLSIIKGVQKALDLSDEALRASYKIYREKGNASSVAVIAVLDQLRNMGNGRKNVMACSFGPGLTIEMARMERVQAP